MIRQIPITLAFFAAFFADFHLLAWQGRSAGSGGSGFGTAAIAEEGRDAYRKGCRICHDTGLTGAPKRGDKNAWTPRVGKGTETLFRHVVDGVGAMPPRGNCLDCTDKELQEALDYLIRRSR